MSYRDEALSATETIKVDHISQLHSDVGRASDALVDTKEDILRQIRQLEDDLKRVNEYLSQPVAAHSSPRPAKAESRY